MQRQRLAEYIGLIVWLGLSFAVAWTAARFEPGDWYHQLQKPTWTPPGWVFGPVWTVLYVLMAVAAWLVWRQRRSRAVTLPLGIYLAQLLLNGLWSWIFFGHQAVGLALLDIILLWIAILATVVLFWSKHRLAGILLMPYLLWVSFAAALNYTIWKMN